MPQKLEFKPADFTKEVVAEERSNSRVVVQEAYSVRRYVRTLSMLFSNFGLKDNARLLEGRHLIEVKQQKKAVTRMKSTNFSR